jgi:glutamate racemase
MVTSMISPAMSQQTVAQAIARLAERDSITVLVTDSGLGGLSVCADLDQKARATGRYRVLNIIFCNALPEASQGYNKMPSVERKIRVFDDALAGMARWYAPDAVLVACNTLSVLIPRTAFVHTSPVPVLGIVEMGVDALTEKLSADSTSTGIVFGTETTIAAGTHRTLLLARGIAPDRVVTQACPDLAGEIESDARSGTVSTAIDLFAGEAMKSVRRKGSPLVAGLCCTHYGYCGEMFGSSLRRAGANDVIVVNPNSRMSDVFFPPGAARRSPSPQITVRVVSRAVITPAEMASIGGLVEPVSRATAAALRTYELKRDLFPYQP